MKRLIQGSIPLPKAFKIFIAVMTLLSIFAGYLLSQLVHGIDDAYLQRTEKILAMERNLGDATVALGRQIQEWKDMLLRSSDAELFNKHRQAFFEDSAAMKEALQRTKTAMHDEGLDTREIEQLDGEHQSLESDYMLAKSLINPKDIDSYLEADRQVAGVDRKLQQHIAVVKTEIERYSNQQLQDAMHARGSRYLLGLLGAASLLFVSLASLLFAVYYPGNKK